MSKRILTLAGGCLISGVSLWWLFSRMDASQIADQIRKTSVSLWFFAAITYLVGFVPRAFRWRLMLSPIVKAPLKKLAHAILLGYAGNNVLPFRLGEVVRAIAFERLTNIPAATGLASVVIERLIDGLTIVLVLLTTLAFAPHDLFHSHSLRPIFLGAAIISVVGVVGAFLAVSMGASFVHLAERISPRVGDLFRRANEGFQFLRKPAILIGVVAASLLTWTIEGAMFVILANGLGIDSPVLTGYLALAVVNLGILIPSAPGYIGIFQMASVLAFSVLGHDRESGLVFGILVHSAQFLPVTILGAIAAVPLWADLRKGATTTR